MSLRMLVVGVEFSVGALLVVWGVASAARPSLWRRPGARWWVDRTRRTISRAHGLGVGLVGVAIAVSAPAPLISAPAASGGTDAQSLEVIGLVAALLGAILLAVTFPTPRQEGEPQGPSAREESPASEQDVTIDHVPRAVVPAPTPALAASSTAR